MYKKFFSFHQVIRIRLLLKFFTVLTKTMVLPYTVIYFSMKIGVELTTILIFVVGIISIIGYLIGGKSTDKYGRKNNIMYSELVTGIGFVVIGVLDTFENMYMVPILLAFCAIYFFESMSSPAYSALIIDVSNENNRKEIYTYFMWINSIGFAIGSLIGGFYFESFSSVLFILVGITSFISSIFTFKFIKEKPIKKEESITINDNQKHKGKKVRPSYSMIVINLFFFLCIGQFILNLLKEQFPNYISIRIVSNFPEDNFLFTGYNMIGILNLEETIVIMFSAGLIMKITSKFTDRTNVILGLSLLILGFIILSYFINPFALVLGMFLISIGGLIYTPTIQSVIANSIPEKTRGSHLSILGLLGAIGGIMASIFIAASEYISEMTITYLYCILGLLLIIIYNRTISIYKKHKKTPNKVRNNEIIS